MKKALILAGGLGTRLRPLTFAVPKPLIPVRNRPIIDYIISRLAKFGVEEIYVSLNYQADIIRHYLAERDGRGVKIKYFKENSPLGTAGPLSFFNKNGVKLGKDESVLVINGDILTDLNFRRFAREHKQSEADLTVAMINYTHQLSFGVLELDRANQITGVTEKPTFRYKASAGIYLVSRRCLDLVPAERFTMPELMEEAKKQGYKVKGYIIKEHWLAIEQIKQLAEASEAKKGDWISKL